MNTESEEQATEDDEHLYFEDDDDDKIFLFTSERYGMLRDDAEAQKIASAPSPHEWTSVDASTVYATIGEATETICEETQEEISFSLRKVFVSKFNHINPSLGQISSLLFGTNNKVVQQCCNSLSWTVKDLSLIHISEPTRP
eukprot:4893622-Ditylum_brightwellii.AAC.1